jgi:hydrogenase maturation protein HypF
MQVKPVGIKITGLLQGVGFRPFIYRIAIANQVKCWVVNNVRGVTFEAEAEEHHLTDIFYIFVVN